MQRSRSLLALVALALAGLAGFLLWRMPHTDTPRLTRAHATSSTATSSTATSPTATSSTAASSTATSPTPTAAMAEGPPWGVVAVLPCHGDHLVASGNLLYGCRDRINTDTGRIAQLGTFGDGRLLRDGEEIAAISGDLIVHGVGPAWRVSRRSTGAELQHLDAGDEPLGRRGDVVWWSSSEGGAVGFDLASMSRVDAPLAGCTFGRPGFDAEGGLACIARCATGLRSCLVRAHGASFPLPDLREDEGDAAGTAGTDRFWIRQSGTVRWLHADGTEDATLEPLTDVDEFGVADATEDRILAWSWHGRRSWFVLTRDPATSRWRRHNLASQESLQASTTGALLDSGRVAIVSEEEVWVLAENGERQTPVAPLAAPRAGMLALTMDSEGVWGNGDYEVQPTRTPNAVFVLPETEENAESYFTVNFLHRGVFADLPEAELEQAVTHAVLPDGSSRRVRTWREDGVRRWRMQAVNNDCYYDAVALDVRERGDFFEVWETHLGTRCREVEGRAAESCRNADDAFGPVPRAAASLDGLNDAYSGDASLSP